MFALALALVNDHAQLDAVLDDRALGQAVVGACVVEEDGTVLYERNADLRLVPASNQKLLTNAFAFETLGPDYRPVTRFWDFADRVIVDAPGDPTLTYDNLVAVRRQLGIHPDTPIRVKLAFDPKVPPTWQLDDLTERYAARVTALSYDRAGFEVWAKDGKVERLQPEIGVRLRRGVTFGRPRVEYDLARRTVTVNGELPTARTLLQTYAQPEPERAAAAALGGRFVLETGDLPVRAPDLTIVGPPLTDVARYCLQQSDNGYAERLLLIAAGKKQPLGPDPYSAATDRLRAFLTKTVGLRESDANPYDGSGMSRHGLVTARAITKLLLWVEGRPYASAFRRALASPTAGTLNGRLQGLTFFGKTGTLDNVTALSGYLTAADGRRMVVSLIVNHTIAPSADVRGALDRFVRVLAGKIANGTAYAPSIGYARRLPYQGSRPVARHRPSRLGGDRRASCTWAYHGTQPVDAAAD